MSFPHRNWTLDKKEKGFLQFMMKVFMSNYLHYSRLRIQSKNNYNIDGFVLIDKQTPVYDDKYIMVATILETA